MKHNRNTYVGGSDAAAVLGLSPWKTAVEVWLEKTGRYQEDVSNAAVYWGNQLEDLVADEYQVQTGRRVRRHNKVQRHPVFPYLGGLIDRKIVGQPGILEVKTTGQAWGGEVPVCYQLQAQHYLGLRADWEFCDFAVLESGRNFWTTRLERDDEAIAAMHEAEIEFWEKHVEGDVQPDLDYIHPATRKLLDLLNIGTTEAIVELRPSLHNLATRYAELSDELANLRQVEKALKAEREPLENQLLEEMADAGRMIVQGLGEFKRSWVPASDVSYRRRAYSRFTFKHSTGEEDGNS